MVYIRQGIQYYEPSCASTKQMELQKAIIHLARRRQISVTNVYLPPHHSQYHSIHQNDQTWVDHPPKAPSLLCADLNAHHSSWDDDVSADPLGSALHEWMEAHSRALLNDGSPTQDYIRRPTATPKRIGSSSAIAPTTVSMQCHRPTPCPNVWRPYVTS